MGSPRLEQNPSGAGGWIRFMRADGAAPSRRSPDDPCGVYVTGRPSRARTLSLIAVLTREQPLAPPVH